MVTAFSKASVLLHASQWCDAHDENTVQGFLCRGQALKADPNVKVEAGEAHAPFTGSSLQQHQQQEPAVAKLREPETALAPGAAAVDNDRAADVAVAAAAVALLAQQPAAPAAAAAAAPGDSSVPPESASGSSAGSSSASKPHLCGLLDSLADLASAELMSLRSSSSGGGGGAACSGPEEASPLPRTRRARPRSQSNPEGMERSAGWRGRGTGELGGGLYLGAGRRSPDIEAIKEEGDEDCDRSASAAAAAVACIAAAAAAALPARPAIADGDDAAGSAATAVTLPHLLSKYTDVYNRNGRIGIYTAQEREAIIARFKAKRLRRVWRKKIRYNCRKNLADKRLRIKGRFVKMTPAQRAALQLQRAAEDGANGASPVAADDAMVEVAAEEEVRHVMSERRHAGDPIIDELFLSQHEDGASRASPVAADDAMVEVAAEEEHRLLGALLLLPPRAAAARRCRALTRASAAPLCRALRQLVAQSAAAPVEGLPRRRAQARTGFCKAAAAAAAAPGAHSACRMGMPVPSCRAFASKKQCGGKRRTAGGGSARLPFRRCALRGIGVFRQPVHWRACVPRRRRSAAQQRVPGSHGA
ncbi:hypothetical protein JKP88DRAFT_295684 [Tribonema minus]|uniref:CCT domain-containing protein n=1 Tax=Tribonema minus TaxID=303371 RepID=A0A835ZBX8_9STRA|nr:hypothetical protein JKP88DRAFT_295684 [Tribonema minus]